MSLESHLFIGSKGNIFESAKENKQERKLRKLRQIKKQQLDSHSNLVLQRKVLSQSVPNLEHIKISNNTLKLSNVTLADFQAHTSNFMKVLSKETKKTEEDDSNSVVSFVRELPSARNLEPLQIWKRHDKCNRDDTNFTDDISVLTNNSVSKRRKHNPTTNEKLTRQIVKLPPNAHGFIQRLSSEKQTFNSDINEAENILSVSRKEVLDEYLGLVNTRNNTTESDAKSAELFEAQLFTAKVALSEDTKESTLLASNNLNSLSKRRAFKDGSGIKSRLLMNKLIDEVQDIAMSAYDLTVSASVNGEGYNSQTYEEWKSTYHSENTAFDSIAVFVEIRFMELKEREKHHGSMPTKLKACVVADLLLKLCGSMDNQVQIFAPLVYELLNAIFCDYASTSLCFSTKQSLQDFSCMHTFFDRHKDVTEKIEDLQQEIEWIKEGIQMKSIVRKFQCVRLVFDTSARFLRDTCFNLWKSVHTRSEYYRNVCIKKVLNYCFHLFRKNMLRQQKHKDNISEAIAASGGDKSGVLSYKKSFSAQGDHLQQDEEFSEELDQKIEKLKELQVLIEKHNEINLPTLLPSSALIRPDAREVLSNDSLDPTAIDHIVALERQNTNLKLDGGTVSKTNSNDGADGEAVVQKPTISKLNAKLLSSLGHFKKRSQAIKANILTRKVEAEALAQEAPTTTVTNNTTLTDGETATTATTGDATVTSDTNTATTSRINTQTRHASMVAYTSDTSSNILDNSNSSSSGVPGGELNMEEMYNNAEALEAQINRLAESILKQVKSVMTQTPDEWMGNVDESLATEEIESPLPSSSPAQSKHDKKSLLQSSFDILSGGGAGGVLANVHLIKIHGSQDLSDIINSYNKNAANVSNSGENSGNTSSSGAKRHTLNNPPLPISTNNTSNKYHLSLQLAGQLISYVYSSMFPEEGATEPLVSFSKHNNVMTYMKELFMHKYGTKKIADKFYKGLVACCLSQSSANKRIKLFCGLCGITASLSKFDFDAEKFDIFLNILGILFNKNAKLIRTVFNMERPELNFADVMKVLPLIIPTIEQHEVDLYKHFVDEISSLQSVNLAANDPLQAKINVDSLLILLMEYSELEQKEKENKLASESTEASLADLHKG